MLKVEKDLKNIIQLYCYDNLSDNDIAKMYDVSSITISRFRRKNNVIKLYDDKEWLNQKYNIEKLTLKQITDIIHCSKDQISLRLKKFGYSIDLDRGRIAGRKYHYNERIFEQIDSPEKAYWLGFITADGNIEQLSRTKADGTIYNNYRLTFCLSKKDKKHLEKFCEFLGDTNLPISEYTTFLDKTNKSYQIVSLKIYCRQLAIDLMNHNIFSRKSCKEIPPLITEDLIPHFIRGELDGDGCLMLNDKKINIVGSNELMLYIKQETSNKFKRSIGYIHKDKKSKDLYSYNIYAAKDCQEFLEWIYKDATIYLDRKYNIYKNNINNNIYIDKRYSPTSTEK